MSKLFIYQVYAGLDAFVYTTSEGEEIYLPYIVVLAKDQEDAREKTAKILGQKLDDQDTNLNYKNFICRFAEQVREW